MSQGIIASYVTDDQLDAAGLEMYALASELFPICRSQTGNGVRRTLKVLQRHIPLEIHEVSTGESAFDWQVPLEWNIREAYIRDSQGRRVVDFDKCNLHVVSGSMPVNKTMPWSKLKEHLFADPLHPEWIPYRTTFFEAKWGFCLSHRQFVELDSLGERDYQVRIDATREAGSLSYGELFLCGSTQEEVLISTHICHPSLANDNLSGIAVATCLARLLMKRPRRYGYRFVFAPATIGPIVWLARNENRLSAIKHGLVLALLGDCGISTYKRSRHETALIDRTVEHVLKHADSEFEIRNFDPFGYDERQYGSPGINLPVGCFMRTPNGEYAQYHTSADNMDLICPTALADSWAKCVAITEILEHNRIYVNLHPKCEPRLGNRGLYFGYGHPQDGSLQQATMWVLNQSDGEQSLLDIAGRSDLPFPSVAAAAQRLIDCKLLAERSPSPSRGLKDVAHCQ